MPQDEDDALWLLVRLAATQIIEGEVGAYEGAAWIWGHASDRVKAEGDLRVFIGLASEWEDHPAYRSEIEATIVEEAGILLGRPKPRTWVKVMARQGSGPLWEPRTHSNLSPADLPIDNALTSDLVCWAAQYDSTFGGGPEDSSGFASREEALEFVERGRDLVERLQESLGNSWHVEYIPEPISPPGLRVRGVD
ncbi:MAG TPA: hypothetical protein VG015_03005 [Candidatus Dormibacteraeota bacterium]|nr:hypothetical protein [Candidatus Dormibacteraeota bacterium]